MRVAFGADHAGAPHKDKLMLHLQDRGITTINLGTDDYTESVDYPDFASAVAEMVARGDADYGVLVCGTGIGMAIAANKVKGIRSATITDPEIARLTRQHNNTNVLSLSGRFVDYDINEKILDAFLETEFEGGRHQGRLDKIEEIEKL